MCKGVKLRELRFNGKIIYLNREGEGGREGKREEKIVFEWIFKEEKKYCWRRGERKREAVFSIWDYVMILVNRIE